MPMAGLGTRFQTFSGLPKPLISLQGKSMFLRALSTLPTAEKNVFVTRNEVISSLKEQEKVGCFIGLDHMPEGQALTTELGLQALDLQKDVIVSACDHGIVLDPKKWSEFKASDFDAAVFTVKGFPGVRRNPTFYSYVDSDDTKRIPIVKKVSVKKPISEVPQKDHLLVGTFWFKSAKLLSEGITDLKKENARVNNELYLDAVFNSMIDRGLNVAVIELEGYLNWGDPDSLKEALYWQEVFMGQSLSIRGAFPGVQF